jgi:hypothetical protein
MTAPSAPAIERAFIALAEARERLLAIDANLPEDERAWIDNLEGEAKGDPLRTIDRLVEAAIEADIMAGALHVREIELAERRARFLHRNETLRTIARDMLQALEVKRLERAGYTASIGLSPGKVHVSDVDLLPPQYTRVTVTADKTALHSALKLGDEIPGATLGNGEPTITIRTT